MWLGGVLDLPLEWKRLVLHDRYLTPINPSRDRDARIFHTRDSPRRYAPSSSFYARIDRRLIQFLRKTKVPLQSTVLSDLLPLTDQSSSVMAFAPLSVG